MMGLRLSFAKTILGDLPSVQAQRACSTMFFICLLTRSEEWGQKEAEGWARGPVGTQDLFCLTRHSQGSGPHAKPLTCLFVYPQSHRPLPCPSPNLSQGYSIASRHPVVRQKGDQNPKADHSEEEVQQPGHNLERVRRPAPPIPTGPLALQLRAGLCGCSPHALLGGCFVGGSVANGHLRRRKEQREH